MYPHRRKTPNYVLFRNVGLAGGPPPTAPPAEPSQCSKRCLLGTRQRHAPEGPWNKRSIDKYSFGEAKTRPGATARWESPLAPRPRGELSAASLRHLLGTSPMGAPRPELVVSPPGEMEQVFLAHLNQKDIFRRPPWCAKGPWATQPQTRRRKAPTTEYHMNK